MKEFAGCLKNAGTVIAVVGLILTWINTVFYQSILYSVLAKLDLIGPIYWIYLSIVIFQCFMALPTLFLSNFLIAMGASLETKKEDSRK